MDPAQSFSAKPESASRARRGLGLGVLALGLACLGCCLAPLLWVFMAAGAGTALAGFLQSWAAAVTLGGAVLALAIFLAWKARRTACCSKPGLDCRPGICDIRSRGALSAMESMATFPGCRLSPEAQASRVGQLRRGLFGKIDSIIEGDGKLRMRFADKPENIRELIDFIRFERECCTSLRFCLEWEPKGGPVILEMKGPVSLLKSLKDSVIPEGLLGQS